jgi:acyl-coenzyme A thioesterase PaaI-like protein
VTDLPTGATAIPSRLGVTARFDDRGLVLDLAPGAEVLRHGVVRASVLAYMVDAGAGITVDGDETTWTFTTDLSVRMQARPAPPQVTATTVVLRQGRRSATLSVDLLAGDGGEVVAGGAIGFARVPRKPTDPPKPIVLPETAPERFRRFEPLTRPLREEAGVVVIDAGAGVAELAVVPDVCNPAGTLQGAMVALLAEAAAEDLATARAGEPMVVVDLDVRYLAQTGAGPVRTSCRPLGDDPADPVEVRLVDVSTGRLTTLVHTRAVTRTPRGWQGGRRSGPPGGWRGRPRPRAPARPAWRRA